MKQIKIIIFLLYFIIAFKLKAQTLPTAGVEITKAIPASPDAAALGKYGSIPVSPYTGVPSISVPLYTIRSGDLTLPVSLSYHAGGLKVEELASSVGLGWSLNAGGAITRTIRGKADEEEFGFLDANHYVPKIDSTINGYGNYTNNDLNNYLNLLAEGTMDGEADMYNYNFGGYSGKFVMDTYGHVFTIPQSNIKFTFTVNGGGPYIDSFTAITPDGVSYVFGSDAIEKTNSRISCAVSSGPTNKKDYVTSWFITSMISPTGHQINFNYTAENYTVSQTRTQTKYQVYALQNVQYGAPGHPEDQDCAVSNAIHGVKLSSIAFENGFVSFTTGARQDISNARFIDSIKINDVGMVKQFKLYYTNTNTTRLRLDSLTERSGPVSKKQSWNFVYNTDGWTTSSNYQQDWWGYFNGRSSNSTLVPAETLNVYGGGSIQTLLLPGANRATDEQAMLGGVLTQVNYPTGGHTSFSYEANHASNVDLDGTSINFPPTSHTKQLSNDPGSVYYGPSGEYNIKIDTMHIVSQSGNKIALSIHGSGFATSADPASGDGNYIIAGVSKLDSLGNYVLVSKVPNSDTVIYVLPGTYQVKVTDNKNQGYSDLRPDGFKWEIFISWATNSSSLYYNYIVGGLRVKQIADYDGSSGTSYNLKTYQYQQPGLSYSSGWLDFQPAYSYNMIYAYGDGLVSPYTLNTYHVRTAVSNYPLGTTQGSVVGYAHVTEFNGLNGENGKTEYFYTNSQSNADYSSAVRHEGTQSRFVEGNTPGDFPFAPPTTVEWKRGLLLKQVDYKYLSSNNFAKTHEKTCTYNSFGTAFSLSIKGGFFPIPVDAYSQVLHYYNGSMPGGGVMVDSFTDYSDFTFLFSDVTKVYNSSDTSQYVQTTNHYSYDPDSYQLAKVTTNNSRNEIITQKVTYPNNYTIPGTSTNPVLKGLLNLQSKHIINVPIEVITQKQNADSSNLHIEKAILTTYKANQPLRDTVFETRSVIPLSSFSVSAIGSNTFNMDSHYQPVVAFNKYNANGNIVQESQIKGPLRSYIWGYLDTQISTTDHTYPIAEAINADSASIAYTNFDAYTSTGSTFGNWAYNNAGSTTDASAPMGSKCYSLSGYTISKSGLSSSATYLVSFWAKSGAAVTVSGGTVIAASTGETINGWTYYEYRVMSTTTVSVSGTGLIDELRLYPVDAQMSTYTYLPLIGIRSSADPKNKITYYEYDSFQRLMNIKDQYGNIVKHMDYHYQNQ
jgi:hypothetical protein